MLFHGLPEKRNEKWDDTEKTLKEFIKGRLNVDTDSIKFERVHRLNSNSEHRPIIAKFSSFKDKERVFRAARILKGSNERISEDFTRRVRDTRSKLVPFLIKAREDGKKATLRYDKLMIDGRPFVFNPVTNDIDAV